MNNKYLKLIPAISGLFLLTLFGQTQAVGPMKNNASGDRSQKKVAQELEEKADKWEDQAKKLTNKWQGTLESEADDKGSTQRNRERICEAVQNRVGERWQKYYDARMARVRDLDLGVLALQNRVEFFKSNGLDTAKLESDITTLRSLIDDYKTVYNSFLTSLEEVKTLPCVNYDNRFLGELKQARDGWEAVRASREAIKNFYTNQAKLDLKDLLMQLAEQNLGNEEK